MTDLSTRLDHPKGSVKIVVSSESRELAEHVMNTINKAFGKTSSNALEEAVEALMRGYKP